MINHIVMHFGINFRFCDCNQRWIEGKIMYFIDHKQPIYIQDNPKPNRKEYEVS